MRAGLPGLLASAGLKGKAGLVCSSRHWERVTGTWAKKQGHVSEINQEREGLRKGKREKGRERGKEEGKREGGREGSRDGEKMKMAGIKLKSIIPGLRSDEIGGLPGVLVQLELNSEFQS